MQNYCISHLCKLTSSKLKSSMHAGLNTPAPIFSSGCLPSSNCRRRIRTGVDTVQDLHFKVLSAQSRNQILIKQRTVLKVPENAFPAASAQSIISPMQIPLILVILQTLQKCFVPVMSWPLTSHISGGQQPHIF